MKKLSVASLAIGGVMLALAPQASAHTILGETWGAPGYNTGSAQISWSLRGGSCQIYYTEASQSVYKYTTSASCDDGHLSVNYLAPGKAYRFVVAQNGWMTNPVTVKASAYTKTAEYGVGGANVVATKTLPIVPPSGWATAWAGTGWTGTVNLGWSLRTDRCEIRYNEADQAGYKYSTVAGCDDLKTTIGGLVPGKAYRFIVSQNGHGNWSKPVTARAGR